MSFYDLIKSRRSIRNYLPEKVESEKITKILNSALMSPASKRSNPWEFIVVQNREMLKKLALSRPSGSQFIAQSPLGIIIVADTTKSDVWIENASIAATLIQLQAHDLGLGSCWVQVRNRYTADNQSTESYIRNLMQIPEKYAVLCIISIGYPDELKNEFDVEKLEKEKIHFEEF